MRWLQLLANALLLFTIPAMNASPTADIHSQATDSKGVFELNNELFSYDDVLDLIEEIEDGDIEERCTPEEIAGINQFMALLAKQGILPGDISQEFALNRDIEHLLFQNNLNWAFSYSLDGGYSIEPAIFYGQADVVLCRSWVKKKWDQTRKFVKKHKKEIIIGAAVVVAAAVTVAVVVVVASSSAIAAVATGTAAGVASSISNGNEESPEPAVHPVELIAIPVQEVPILKEVIDECAHVFKERMATEAIINPEKILTIESPSFVQDAREFGAALAHSVFEGASQIVSAVPQLLEEIRDAGERFIPKSVCDLQPSDVFNPLGNYRHAVDKMHNAIDRFFGVSQPQDGPIAHPEFTYAVLPPPGPIGSMVSSEGRLTPTQVNSTRGWRVGQPIHNRTFWGGVPKWSTVRSRYWKNRAEWAKCNPGHDYGDKNIPRMERGLAPQRYDDLTGQIESIELHHIPPQREGGLFDFIEVSPIEHARLDKFKRLKK